MVTQSMEASAFACFDARFLVRDKRSGQPNFLTLQRSESMLDFFEEDKTLTAPPQAFHRPKTH